MHDVLIWSYQATRGHDWEVILFSMIPMGLWDACCVMYRNI